MIPRITTSPDYDLHQGQVAASLDTGKLTNLSVTVVTELWNGVKLHYTHRNLMNHILNRVLSQILNRLDELGETVPSPNSQAAIKTIIEEEMTPLAKKPYERPH